MKIKLGSLAIIAGLVTLPMACSKSDETDQPEGDAQTQFDARMAEFDSRLDEMHETNERLVGKYNKILHTSYDLQLAATNEAEHLIHLDAALVDYSAAVSYFLIETNSLCTVSASTNEADAINALWSDLETKRLAARESVAGLEHFLLEEIEKLRANARNVYESPEPAIMEIADLLTEFATRSESLEGIYNLLRIAANSTNREMERCGLSTEVELTIELDADEAEVADIDSGSGIARDSSGALINFSSSTEVETYAQANGFDAEAASDAYRMSSNTNGLMRFAKDSDDLTQSVKDMLSHIKRAMLANSDDLELVFALDYSGSMADEIESVTANLIEITKSLEAVRTAGRQVKIGIVTFGQPGRERLDLNLTDSLIDVQSKLRKLLADYDNNNHSVGEGEASYYGLKKAIDVANWRSKNRKIILITDEPSHSVQTGNLAYVESVESALSQSGTEVALYPIVVKQGL